jgi:predicted ester cyclase
VADDRRRPAAREAENLAAARRYVDAVEAMTRGAALAAFFAEDVVHEELPNRLTPNGVRQGLSGILAAAERGAQALTAQQYAIETAVASGDHVALEVRWTGTLAVPMGAIPAGGQLRARFALFLEYRAGRIVRQRNYDCFEPF